MDFTVATVDGVICLSLTAVIQYVLKDLGWDLDINIDLLFILSFLHVPFNVVEDVFKGASAAAYGGFLVRPASSGVLACSVYLCNDDACRLASKDQYRRLSEAFGPRLRSSFSCSLPQIRLLFPYK